MTQHLEGKAAVVTGGGRGIGRGIALTLAAQGARVVVADYGGRVDAVTEASRAPADAVVAEIRAAGGEALACYEDVSTLAGGRRVVEAALDRFGRLDGLVCCAGIHVRKYLWELEEREWDEVIAVHLKGHFACAQAAARVMMPRRSGRLIFISSAAARGAADQPSYSAAKAGILGFAWSCADALEPYGITVNTVLPGGATRMTDEIWGAQGQLTETVGQKLRSDLAAGTYRDPVNVAPLVVYLLSDRAAGVTGQVFGAVGYQIARLGDLGFAAILKSDGPWDLDALFERFPKEMGEELRRKPLPWPPSPA